jgi:Flp pilus assembly protein TadG
MATIQTVRAALRREEGSALLEFAIALPILVVFVVGIFDFGGAFNQKQKIAQAAQAGAIAAAAQPTSDIDSTNGNPTSLQPVVNTVFNSLTGSGIIASGACTPPGTVTQPGSALTWSYKITGCNPAYSTDPLIITINRGWVCSGTPCSTAPPYSIGSTVTVQYTYHWRFNSVIQLVVPGAHYATTTNLQEVATVHNQT